MRVTDSIIFRNFLSQLQDLNRQYAKYSEQVTTGKRINRPSDDPVASTTLLALKSELSSLSQFSDSIKNADRRLESSDSRLNDVSLAMTRVIQLNEQAANETTVGIPRKGIAQELLALTDEILGHADAQVNGRALFAGTRNTTDSLKAITNNPYGRVYSAAGLNVTTDSAATITGTIPDARFYGEHIYQIRITDGANGYEVIDLEGTNNVVATGTFAGPPDTINVEGMELTWSAGALAQGDVFTIVPVYAYNGTEQDIELQVDENSYVVQNVKGTDPFGGTEPTGAVQNPGNTLFDDLVELRRAMLTDDQDAIEASLVTIRDRYDTVSQVRANVGGRISNLRALDERSLSEMTDLLVNVANVENADLASAITELTQTEGGRQAALAAGARIGQLNLFDYLG
jgi:flagellar hook-associated protein 3 FlgL